ncbi:MAG: VCBS domain-containing protein [Bilophila sp.]
MTVNITGTADSIKLDSTDAHVIEITEAGTVFGQQNTPNNAVESADGMFNVTPVDQPDSEGNHLHYGFMVDGEFHEGSYQTQYGTLTIDGEGHYVFTLNEAANALPEKVTEKLEGIELAVRDDRHPDDMFTTQKLEIYIHGSNDRPYFTDGAGNEIEPDDNDEIVFTAQPDSSSAPLEESGNHTLTGKLTADDPDSNHNPGDLSFSILFDKNGDGKIDTSNELIQVVEGKYGKLTLNQDGTYTYELTNPGLLESLNPGQSLIESALADEVFDIRVTDPSGAYTDGKLTIDVTGTANVPVIKDVKLEVTEDNGMPDVALDGTEVTCKIPLDLAGLKDAADLEGEVTWTITPKEGSAIYGEISIDSEGNYIYTLTENGNKVIQELNVDSEPLHQTFTVKAETAGGKTVEKEITVTIKGTNDRPVLDVDLAQFRGEVTQNVFEEEGSNRGDMGENVTGVIFEDTLTNSAASDIDDAGWKYMLVDKNGNPVSELKTEFGMITLHHETNEDGSITTSYTYKLDNYSKTLEEALKEAKHNKEDLFDEVNIVAVDPHGAVSEKEGTISIKINDGENGGTSQDIKLNPESDLNASVQEDGEPLPEGAPDDPATNRDITVTGQLDAIHANGTDVPDRVFGIEGEKGDQVQGHVAADGKYGYLVVDPVTGKYTYTLYNGEDGKSNPVAGPRGRRDGYGNLQDYAQRPGHQGILTITIHGTNDAPTINARRVQAHGDLTKIRILDWWICPSRGAGELDIDRPLVRDDEGNIQLDENDKPIYGDPATVTYQFSDKYDPANIKTDTVDGHIVYTLTIDGKVTATLDSVTGEYTFTVDPTHHPEPGRPSRSNSTLWPLIA